MEISPSGNIPEWKYPQMEIVTTSWTWRKFTQI
jgi:hypothetical protein